MNIILYHLFALRLFGLGICLVKLMFFYLNPTLFHADNTSVIQIYVNLIFHERSKHIKVDFHSICKAFDQHVITLSYISIKFQMVNMFTKTLSRHRHQFMIDKLMFRFVIHQHQTLNLLEMKFHSFYEVIPVSWPRLQV